MTDLIYYVKSERVWHLYISNHEDLIKNVLQLVHNKISHSDFHRIYKWVTESFYIRKLYIILYNFIWHCFICQTMTSSQHSSYRLLQSIATSVLSYYIIIIDFVLDLSTLTEDFDCTINIMNKHSKWIMFISDKITFTAV